MPANYEHGRLIVSQGPGGVTLIEGITDASPDLMAVVGTVKEAAVIELQDGAKLERALVSATQSGKKVMDGYIKFAQPITIQVGATKQASNAVATLDDNGLLDFIEKLSHIQTLKDDDCIEKAAACDFVNNWINKVELDKVDGNEVGLTAPVKVAFANERAKEWFLSLFNKKAGVKQAGDSLVERLIEAGVNKAAALDKVAAAIVQRKKATATN